MNFLLTVVALAAVAYAAPTSTHTMEIGANGVVAGSVSTLQNIPLVKVIVNVIKDAQITPESVHNVDPVIVVDEAEQPTPVVVVDEAVNTEPVAVVDLPVVVVPEVPEVNPIDVLPVNPAPASVVPQPIVLPQRAPAAVVPGTAPVGLPGPTELVVPAPTPAEVVEPVVMHESADAGSSQIINVMMNFIFGASGSLSSVELPANVIPQMTPRV